MLSINMAHEKSLSCVTAMILEVLVTSALNLFSVSASAAGFLSQQSAETRRLAERSRAASLVAKRANLTAQDSEFLRQFGFPDGEVQCNEFMDWKGDSAYSGGSTIKKDNNENLITCGKCTALVNIAGNEGETCDDFCESFGHKCVGAAEEDDNSCELKKSVMCNKPIAHTSSLFCKCASYTYCAAWPYCLPPCEGVDGTLREPSSCQCSGTTCSATEYCHRGADSCKSLPFLSR